MTATGKLTQRVGQMLKGRYRIDQALHCGAESTVYAGMDMKAGRVAIKVFDRLSDASLVSRCHLANAVGHPSSVSVLDSGNSEDGAAFVVMELLEASSMSELLSKHAGRLPVRMGCDIADQALALLASAHAQGIVHGELELGKLFYTRAEQLKVIGFGKVVSGAEQSAAFADDVRSLTRVVAQLLTGKPVETLLLSERTSRSSQPFGLPSPMLPRRIASVIQRGLTNDAAQHWQTASAMRTALQLACLAELGRPVDRELRRLAQKQKPRHAGLGLWLLGAAAALLGSALVVRELVQAPLGAKQAADAAEAAQLQEDVAPATSRPHAATGVTERTTASPSATAQEPQPAGVVPRKPSIPALRVQRELKSSALPTNIAPANALCAQLSAARNMRSLNEEEAQLWRARCGTH